MTETERAKGLSESDLSSSSVPVIPLSDPDNVAVRTANSIIGLHFAGSVFDLTLATSRLGAGPEGNVQVQSIIAARLRFDMDFARAFHSQLGQAIAALTSPPKDQQN